MEQLWYTSCRNGLGSGSGNMPRAASRGLKDLRSERYARLSRFLRYNLPAGVNPNTARPDDAPRNLALLDTGKERILLHQVYVGLDYTGMRYGNHFSHLLVDVPKEVTARDAIGLWRSPFWAESEVRIAPGVYDLPLVERTDLVTGRLAHGHLDSPVMRDRLEYIIRAYLTLPEGKQLYIVAPSDTVAMLIWGLAQCLPDQLIAGLTFVTYTDNVNAVEAQIVGTGNMAGSTALPDLPDPMYTEKGRVLNCYTSRSSPLIAHPQVDAYAAYATRRLAVDDPDLRNLRDLAENAPAWHQEEFLQAAMLFMAVTSSAGPAFADLAQLLDQPEMAARVLDRPRIQKALLEACADLAGSEPGRWWGERGGLALNGLTRYTDRVEGLEAATRALIEPTVQACQAALRAGNLAVAERIYNEALLAVLHSDKRRASDLLLNGLRPSDVPDLRARVWLLSRAAAAWSSDPDGKPAEVQSWLEASWHELGSVLDVAGLPQSWQVQAVEWTLRRCEPPGDVDVDLVDRHPQVFRSALADLARKPETIDCAERFFAAVVGARAGCKLALLGELARAVSGLPGGETRRNAVLEAAALTAQETIQLSRREPTLMAEPGIAHQLVDRYLQLVANEDWSAWLPLLENPYFAADLIGPERAEVGDRLLDGIARNPDAWMRDGHDQVHRLKAATEPADLHSHLAAFAERALPRALKALTNRNLTAATVLFDDLIRSWSSDVVASLHRLIEDVYLCAAPDNDSEEAWERRKWLLQRAYELRQGISVAAHERFQQVVAPLLRVSHFGLVRLAVFLFDLQGPRMGSPSGTLPPLVPDSIDVVEQWLGIAEGELSTTPPKEQTSKMNTRPGPMTKVVLPIPPLPDLSEQETQSVRRNIERHIERFKAASLRGALEAAYAYFTVICRADNRQRILLLEWVESELKLNTNYVADNLLACAGLMIPGDGDAERPDMAAIEGVFAADVGKTIIKSLAAREQSRQIITVYLQGLNVSSCATPGARAILEQLRENPEWRQLLDLKVLADFWLAVADVQTGKAGAISDVCSQMSNQLLDRLVNQQPVFWQVIDLLVDSARVPKDLVGILKHGKMLQRPTIETGEKLERFLAAYDYFLTKGRRNKPADEAARLLPFAVIALGASGSSSLNEWEMEDARRLLLGWLRDTDAATVQELERLIKQYASDEKKPMLPQAWRELYEKLPKELHGDTGLKGIVRGIFGGSSRSDEVKAGSQASARSRAGQPRPYRTGFMLCKAQQSSMTADSISAQEKLRPDEVEAVYDLWGDSLKSAQLGDFVLVKVKGLTFPSALRPTEDDISDKINVELTLTGRWEGIEIPSNMSTLPAFIQSRRRLDPGPSYRTQKVNTSVPWQAGDVLLIRKAGP
jgi:hypothetical protein